MAQRREQQVQVASHRLVVEHDFRQVRRRARRRTAGQPEHGPLDAAAAELGWREDAWRLDLRARAEPLLSSVERATAVTRAAGLDARVEVERIELPELSPTDLVEWRLGMAHVAPFVLGLDPAARTALVDRAVALMGDAPSLARSIVWISALVP